MESAMPMQMTEMPEITASRSANNWSRVLIAGAVVVVVVLAGIWWFASSEQRNDRITELHGSWLTDVGSTITYLEDGSWEAVYPAFGSEPFDWGTYTFDGLTLSLFTSPGGMVCRAGQTGIYEAMFTDDGNLSLKLLDDPCGDRAAISGQMIRQSR
jgi:hypothetical protein